MPNGRRAQARPKLSSTLQQPLGLVELRPDRSIHRSARRRPHQDLATSIGNSPDDRAATRLVRSAELVSRPWRSARRRRRSIYTPRLRTTFCLNPPAALHRRPRLARTLLLQGGGKAARGRIALDTSRSAKNEETTQQHLRPRGRRDRARNAAALQRTAARRRASSWCRPIGFSTSKRRNGAQRQTRTKTNKKHKLEERMPTLAEADPLFADVRPNSANPGAEVVRMCDGFGGVWLKGAEPGSDSTKKLGTGGCIDRRRTQVKLCA